MKRLFHNEWMKIKYARFLWFLYGGMFLFVLLFGFMPSGVIEWLEYGLPASFGYMNSLGTVLVMLFAPVAGFFFTRELQEGTLQNTLSCGVGRGQYFVVKGICAIVSGLVLYLFSVLEYTLLRGAVTGFLPDSGACPSCGAAEVIVFQLGCCIQMLTYCSCFLLISVLTKKVAVVNLAGIVLWFAEAELLLLFPSYRGPLASEINSYSLWKEGKVLTAEFLKQYDWCILASIVFWALAYLVFRKRDIQ